MTFASQNLRHHQKALINIMTKNVQCEEDEILVMISMDIYIVKNEEEEFWIKITNFLHYFVSHHHNINGQKNNRIHTHTKNAIIYIVDVKSTEASAKKTKKGVRVWYKN